MLRLLGLLALGWISACTSSSGSRSQESGALEAEPLRMTVIDHRTQAVFELVNVSTKPAREQYSTVSKNAARKVQEDELMAEFMEWLDEHGFAERSLAGAAPVVGSQNLSWTLEIERGGVVRHVAETRGVLIEGVVELRKLRDAVLEVYNNTQGWQAIEIQAGEAPFRIRSGTGAASKKH